MPSIQRSQDPALQIEVAELSRDCLLAPSVAELQASSIHIWQFPLTSKFVLDAFTDVLSPDERTRALRFHFERDRRRFTIARATVRSILGAYVGSRNRDIVFDYAHYGKPSLADAASGIRFSVSHSDELAMLAVARDQEVGVDLELIRADVETDKLAERFFSPHERESIRALPDGDRVPAFFHCWTCKEAFLKAQGLGLSRSLDSFDVEVHPQLPARLLEIRPNPQEAAHWFLYDIPVESAYRAAVAVDGPISAMKIFCCR
jgi:4'-phosphopantetheinyl transferase